MHQASHPHALILRPGNAAGCTMASARVVCSTMTAVALGALPFVTFASVQKIPERLDELHVAGARTCR
jgi:3-polyprenyl-4-hydroxybenzoate decarboxylase